MNRFLFLLGMMLWVFPVYADSLDSSQRGRIGGEYQVYKIEKASDKGFSIFFKSVTPTGKHDYLLLESDHLHVNINEGLVIRLSAEIMRIQKEVTEVSQVLLFFADGNSRVFALSKKAKVDRLGGAKYLEMHSPTNDFLIF